MSNLSIIVIEWSDFTPAYRPNEAYTPVGKVSARQWLNFIVSQEGYLDKRAGGARTHTVALGAAPWAVWKSYYLRNNAADYEPMFSVSDNIRYSLDDGTTWVDWGTPLTPTASSTARRYHHTQVDNWVFAGNGKSGEQYAFLIEATPPEAYNFYLETPAAPTSAVAIAGGSMADGDYLYKIVYVREESGVVVAYSEPGASVMGTAAAPNSQIRLSGIADPSDGQITHKYIYRTKVGETTPYYYVNKILVSAAVTTYDNPLADASLPTATTFNNGYMPGTGTLPDSRILNNYQPNWRYVLHMNQRTHAVESDSNRIYLSYYYPDVVNEEQYARNFANYIDVGARTEPIVQMVPLTSDAFAVFFASSIYVVHTDVQAENYAVYPTAVNVGALSSRGVVAVGGLVYYFGIDKQIRVFDGSSSRSISNDVQPELDTIDDDDVDAVVGVWYKGELRFSYRKSGSGTNNRTLIFNLTKGQWRGETHGVNDYAVARHEGGSSKDHGELYAAMATENYVWKLETGTQDQGTDIACTFESNTFRASDVRADYLIIRRAVVETQGSGTITVTITADGTTSSVALTPSGRTDYWGHRGNLRVRGREFLVKIESNGPPVIERLRLEAIPVRAAR